MKIIPKLPKSAMKLPSAKNSTLLFILISGLGLSLAPKPSKKLNKQLLWGVWNYTQIQKNHQVVFTAQEDDTLFLSKQGLFRYHIQGLNKDAAGYVTIIKVPADSSPYNRALEFTYFPIKEFGNIRRVFHIMHVSDSLVIREGNTEFCYKKRP